MNDSPFQNIRHIILDLGGVLLNIDYSASEHAFEALGIANFKLCFSQLSQNAFFDNWETGHLSRVGFLAGMREAAGNNMLTDDHLLNAWNAMIVDFPLRRLELLLQLRSQYDLVLLSNTNEIHEEAFNKLLMKTCGYNSIAHFFDRTYLSHRVGMRKPGEKIFRLILDECNFNAAHTLFIDDSPQHTEAAKTLGIHTILLKPGMTIEDDIFLPKDRAQSASL